MLDVTYNAISGIIKTDATITEDERARIEAALKPKARLKPKLVTTSVAAETLDVSTVTLRKYAQEGHLHPIRYTNRRIRWDLNEIEEFRDRGIRAIPA